MGAAVFIVCRHGIFRRRIVSSGYSSQAFIPIEPEPAVFVFSLFSAENIFGAVRQCGDAAGIDGWLHVVYRALVSYAGNVEEGSARVYRRGKISI